jgi:hypothetical protein
MKIAYILSLLLCMGAADSLYAQQTQFGFLAGPQFTNARYYLHGNKMATEGKWGGHIGATLKIPFEGRLFFTPALYYSMKGFSVTLSDTSSNPGVDAAHNDILVHTMEIAPLFAIYFGREGGARPYVQFGPAGDVAISGRENIMLKNGSTVKRAMTFNGEGYSKITIGLVLRAGYETAKGLFVSAQYHHGIGSLNNNDLGPSITHRVFALSVGKIFARK